MSERADPATDLAVAPAPNPASAARLRLVFMGTPTFSVPTLKALAAAGHRLCAVYTQPPRPAGRGKKERPSPVQAAAEALGLEARTPLSFKDPGEIDRLAALEADALVVVAYGQLLPQPALDAARLGAFNLHASLLPRWRGAAPIQRAIMAGDPETGVGVMRMALALDAGPVLAEARTPIDPVDTAETIHDRLSALGAALMVETLPSIADGSAVETPQDEAGVVYARKIDKAEARIDWTRPAVELDRLIRGLSPAPGAWFELPTANGPERVKALLATPEAAPIEEGPPGLLLDDQLLVACGAKALRLKALQRAGRGPVSAEAFLRGQSAPAGARLL